MALVADPASMPPAGVSTNTHTYYPTKTYREKEMKLNTYNVSRSSPYAHTLSPPPSSPSLARFVFWGCMGDFRIGKHPEKKEYISIHILAP